ncbi:hypothetical protein J0H58_10510 [bacterium]|nr:hypothetical protein [bacterium]
MTTRPTLAALATALAVVVGCGPTDSPRQAVVPAQGKVKLKDGKVPEGAEVTLLPANDDSPDGVKPRGRVGKDGTFRLTTYPGASAEPDGAPPGEYRVAIRWTTRKRASAVDPDEGGPPGPPSLAGDRFGEKYSNPKSSGLRVTVAADGSLSPSVLVLVN